MGQPYQQQQPQPATKPPQQPAAKVPQPLDAKAPQQKNHNMAYGAGGAVAGLAAGALLMHEGEKVSMCHSLYLQVLVS